MQGAGNFGRADCPIPRTCMTQSKSSTDPPSSWPYSASRDPPCDMAHSIQRSWMQFDHQNALPTTSLADSAAASTALQ